MQPRAISILTAFLALAMAGSCGRSASASRDRPDAGGAPPESAALTDRPIPSEPIKPPQLTMKAVALADKSPKRLQSPDPFLPTDAEAVRLPQDFVIGKIGGEGSDPSAYRFAVEFLNSLARAEDVRSFFPGANAADALSAAETLAPLRPVTVRVGSGGRSGDDEASFLVRFVAEERSVSGELHLSRSSGSWLVDDLRLDESVADYGSDGTARFDPFTYTRFL